MTENQLTRINKYLSEVGYCSRRVADQLISEGRVTINGVKAEMGTKISCTNNSYRFIKGNINELFIGNSY